MTAYVQIVKAVRVVHVYAPPNAAQMPTAAVAARAVPAVNVLMMTANVKVHAVA